MDRLKFIGLITANIYLQQVVSSQLHHGHIQTKNV